MIVPAIRIPIPPATVRRANKTRSAVRLERSGRLTSFERIYLLFFVYIIAPARLWRDLVSDLGDFAYSACWDSLIVSSII